MRILTLIGLVFLFLSCGRQVAGEPDIDQIRERLNMNACRIIREDLIFEIRDIEYVNDTTYTALPVYLLPESLTVCPVTLEQWQYVISDDGDDRAILCPSGHGETSF